LLVHEAEPPGAGAPVGIGSRPPCGRVALLYAVDGRTGRSFAA